MKYFLYITLSSFLLAGCSSEKTFESDLKLALDKNPELLMKVIEKNPMLFMDTVQKAAQSSKQQLANQRQLTEDQKINEAIDKPLVPNIRKDDIIRGDKNGIITLVEYSDFECPFCKRGFDTVKMILKKYEGKVRFVYKHLPLSFHKSAKLSAEYYEAIRLEDPLMAIKFHDLVFESQRQISNGEPFLRKIAKQAGANIKLLDKNLKSKIVQIRIQEDMDEAQKFGLQGTPGFVINGVPVKGAYPLSHFDQIIDKLKAKGKLTL